MDKDAIRNQKVFVTLQSVTNLQAAYLRARKLLQEFSSPDRHTLQLRYVEGLKKAIETLGLPIDVNATI
jgi:hypothetical protein